MKLTLSRAKSSSWLAVLAALIVPGGMAEPQRPALEIIPQPPEIIFAGAPFNPAAARLIGVSDNRADRFAARLLRETLRRDTRLIADEMDQLAFGAVSKLVWEGVGTEQPTVTVSGDTSGYHKALASLDAISQRVVKVLHATR